MPTMVRSGRKLRIGSKCARPGVQRVYSRGPEQRAGAGVNRAKPPSKMKLDTLQRAQYGDPFQSYDSTGSRQQDLGRFPGRDAGAAGAAALGPFHMVTTDNDANLDYMDTEEKVVRQHYAFLVDDAEFEQIFNRIRERNLPYWADPGQRKPGETNDHDGGRGLYFEDPNGHLL